MYASLYAEKVGGKYALHSEDLLGFCLFCVLCLDFKYKLQYTLNKQVPEDFQLPVCKASF